MRFARSVKSPVPGVMVLIHEDARRRGLDGDVLADTHVLGVVKLRERRLGERAAVGEREADEEGARRCAAVADEVENAARRVDARELLRLQVGERLTDDGESPVRSELKKRRGGVEPVQRGREGGRGERGGQQRGDEEHDHGHGGCV